MKKNNTMINNNTNNNKEDKGMSTMKSIAKGLAFGWHMAGYGTGYSVTTAKLHTKELCDKVRGTKVIATFADGYAEGSDKAVENYYDKKAKADAKAKAKADEKAAEAALDEMFENMMDDMNDEDEEDEQVEEPTPKNNVVETKEAKTSLLGQDMLAWFMDKNHGWHLVYDNASIVGAMQYSDSNNRRAYVFQEGAVISQYIPTGYCTKYVCNNKIVALEYSDGRRIDLFDNGFIVTK